MATTTISSAPRPVAERSGGTRAAFPWKTILFYAFMVPFVVIWLVPIFTAVVTALRSFDSYISQGPWSIPNEIALTNFSEAWTNGGLSRFMLNSFIITIPALIGCLLLSSMAAFALARFQFRGNLLIYFTFVGGTLLPFQILMLPVWKLANYLNIYNTYWALIVFHMAFQLGFCTFVLRNFMRTIPGEIFDAARVDGAGEPRIFAQHVLPLTLPSLAALATLEFTWIFNDYLWALILVQKESLKPVTTGLASLMGEYQSAWPTLFAGTLIAVVPTILLFVFLQRYFIQGLTMGSGK
jgi:multiple sugar transport system permease protein